MKTTHIMRVFLVSCSASKFFFGNRITETEELFATLQNNNIIFVNNATQMGMPFKKFYIFHGFFNNITISYILYSVLLDNNKNIMENINIFNRLAENINILI